MKIKTYLFISIFLFILINFLSAQSYNFEGDVLADDGNSLVGASVYDSLSQKGIITNEQGYFKLSLKKGKHIILISYVGYNPVSINLLLNKDISKTIILKHTTLSEIVIKGTKQSIHLNSVQKPMEMDMISIAAIPSIIGEPDVMKAITLMPGINQTSEVSSNLTVRGASHDQNLIILDEAPLYQTGHLFGFVSPFNYEAIKDVKVYKNAIPAIYGGKLSSVIELHSKNGNIDSTKWNYSYGLLNAGFSVSTPIIKKKLSLFAAARSFYLGVVTLPWYILYKQKKYKNFVTYYLYDLNINLKYNPNNKEELGIYLYSGQDILPSMSYSDRNHLNKESFTSLKWGNTTLSLKYKRKINNKTFIKNHLTYSNSFNKTASMFVNHTNSDENHGKQRISSLKNYSLKSYMEKYLDNHYLRLGFETGYYFIVPFDDERTGLVNSHIYDKYNYAKADVFVDDLIEKKYWSVYVGLRFSNYFVKSQHNWQLEPRLSFNYKLNKSNSVGIGYQHLAQYSFLLPITNLGLPNDMWVSLLDNMKPSLIDQIFLEYNTELIHKKVSIQSNVFYRKFNSLSEIKNKTSFLFTSPLEWYKRILRDGISYAYGFEIQTDLNFKKNKLVASYTYSRNKYRFEDLNNGLWFNGYYDLPHQFDINTTGKISKKWTYSVHFAFFSGKPVTLPKEILTNTITGSILIYGEKNGNRLSPYHRLDLSFSKTWISKKGKTKSLTFSLYNAYYHKNPFYYEYSREDEIFDDETFKYKKILNPKLNEVGFIPIIPSVSYSVKW